jgi:hypothetical protein
MAREDITGVIGNLPIEIEGLRFDETDSGNWSHAVAYYWVRLKGPIQALQQVANDTPDMLMYYEWPGEGTGNRELL